MKKRIKLYWNVVIRLCDFIYRAIDYGIALLRHRIKGVFKNGQSH